MRKSSRVLFGSMAPCHRIAYGTSLDYPDTTEALDRIISAGGYVLYVTRFEPENNHVVIEALYVRTKMRLVIVGDARTARSTRSWCVRWLRRTSG
jgi:hypothetical protein